jgi:chromosome segregation ATPase
VNMNIQQQTHILNEKISSIVNTGSTDKFIREEVKQDIAKTKEEIEIDVEQKISTMSKFIHSQVVSKMNDTISIFTEEQNKQIQSITNKDIPSLSEQIQIIKQQDIQPLIQYIQIMKEQDIQPLIQSIQIMKEQDIQPLIQYIQIMKEQDIQPLIQYIETIKQYDIPSLSEQIQSITNKDIPSLSEQIQTITNKDSPSLSEQIQTLNQSQTDLQMKLSLVSSSNTNIQLDEVSSMIDNKVSTMGKFITTSLKNDFTNALEEQTNHLLSLKEQTTIDISTIRENLDIQTNNLLSFKTENAKSLIMLKDEIDQTIEKQGLSFTSALELQTNNIHSSLSEMNSNLSSLHSTNDKMNSDISSLQLNLSLTSSQVENNQNNLAELKEQVSSILREEQQTSSSLSLVKDNISTLTDQMTTSMDTLKTIFSTSQKEQDHLKQHIEIIQSTLKTNQETIQQQLETIKSSSVSIEEIDRIIHRIDDIEKWIPKEPNVKMIIHTPQPSKIPKPKPIEIPKEPEPTPKSFKPKSAILQSKPKPTPQPIQPPTPTKSPSTESTFKAKLAEILQQELSKYKLTQYETIQTQITELMEFKKHIETSQPKETHIGMNLDEIKEHIQRELSSKTLSTKTQFGTITEDILKHIEEIIQEMNKLKEQVAKTQPVDDEILRTKLNILSTQTTQLQQTQIETEQKWIKQVEQLKSECVSILTSTSNQNMRLCEYKVELGNIEQSIKQLNEETITPILSKVKHTEDHIKSLFDTDNVIQKEIKQLTGFLTTIKETGLQTSTRLDQMEIREKEREDQFQQIEQQRTEKDKERQQFNELLLEKLRQMKGDIATQIKTTSKEQKDKYDALLLKHAELEALHKQLANNVSGLTQHQAHVDEKLTIHLAKYEQDLVAIHSKHQTLLNQQAQDIQKHTTYLSNLREELAKQHTTIQTDAETTKQSIKQLDTKYIDLQKDIQTQLQKERQMLYEKYVDQQAELERQIKAQMTQIQISLHDNTKYMKVNLEQQIHAKDEEIFQLKQNVQQLQKQVQNINKSSTSSAPDMEIIKEMMRPMIQQMISANTPRPTENTYTPAVAEDTNLESVLHEIRTLKNELVLIKRRLKYLEDH